MFIRFEWIALYLCIFICHGLDRVICFLSTPGVLSRLDDLTTVHIGWFVHCLHRANCLLPPPGYFSIVYTALFVYCLHRAICLLSTPGYLSIVYTGLFVYCLHRAICLLSTPSCLLSTSGYLSTVYTGWFVHCPHTGRYVELFCPWHTIPGRIFAYLNFFCITKIKSKTSSVSLSNILRTSLNVSFTGDKYNGDRNSATN
jgi:hypothetical protein